MSVAGLTHTQSPGKAFPSRSLSGQGGNIPNSNSLVQIPVQLLAIWYWEGIGKLGGMKQLWGLSSVK